MSGDAVPDLDAIKARVDVATPGATRRVARKPHRCLCGRPIQPGDAYLVHVEFPGHDAGYATHAGHPVRHVECALCAARYGRDYLLEPMPTAQLDRYTPDQWITCTVDDLIALITGTRPQEIPS